MKEKITFEQPINEQRENKIIMIMSCSYDTSQIQNIWGQLANALEV